MIRVVQAGISGFWSHVKKGRNPRSPRFFEKGEGRPDPLSDMISNPSHIHFFKNRTLLILSLVFVLTGAGAFVFQIRGEHPESAWQAYLVNFLLWSAIAQGGLLFSAMMHLTKARWPGPLYGLSESFAGFFPVSFLLFLLLFLGKAHVFPWQSHELHGKEVWLNLPFLFQGIVLGF